MGRYGLFERIALPLALLVLVAAMVLVYRDGVLYARARQEARQTEQVVATTAALLSSIKDAETGQRGYLLTGSAEYLEPYNRALSVIRSEMENLKGRTTHEDSQARIPRLEQTVGQKLAELQATIDLRRKNQFEAALKIVSGGQGKALMDEIRTLCAAIEDSARGHMIASQHEAEESAQSLRGFSIGSLLILFFLLSAAILSIGRATAARQKLIRELDASQREAAQARDTLDLTLRSIGDAVIATDEKGEIQFINPVARNVTGWSDDSAIGQPLPRVFRIFNERTRDTVENPVEKVIRLGIVVGLANHTILVKRNGEQVPIDDSAAPIRDAHGKLIGGARLP